MKILARHILWMAALWSIRLFAQPSSCGAVVNTGSNHSILLIGLKPTVNGAALPAGSYITVLYDDNGALKCAGYVQWNGVNTAIAAFGDDDLTDEKDGFKPNEIFTYRVQLPNGNTVGPACISVKYAAGGIFSHAGSFAENGISGLTAFEARTAECPDLCLDIGDYCDDGDENTLNDVVTGNCGCTGTFSAQTIRPFVVANAGTYEATGNYSLAWTLGQIAGETLETIVDSFNCYWLRQGFQQPFEWLPPEPELACVVSTLGPPLENIAVQVFPNPFSGTVTISFEKPFPRVLSLVSPDGRVVFTQKSDAGEDRIQPGTLPAGMYFLVVKEARFGTNLTFKLIKY